jgi:hypothetical protein
MNLRIQMKDRFVYVPASPSLFLERSSVSRLYIYTYTCLHTHSSTCFTLSTVRIKMNTLLCVPASPILFLERSSVSRLHVSTYTCICTHSSTCYKLCAFTCKYFCSVYLRLRFCFLRGQVWADCMSIRTNEYIHSLTCYELAHTDER